MRPPHPGDGGAPRTGSGLAGRRARAATRAVLGPVELFPVPGVQAPPPPCRPARGGAGRHGVRKHPSQHPWRFSHCGSLQVRAFKLRDVTIRRVTGRRRAKRGCKSPPNRQQPFQAISAPGFGFDRSRKPSSPSLQSVVPVSLKETAALCGHLAPTTSAQRAPPGPEKRNENRVKGPMDQGACGRYTE